MLSSAHWMLRKKRRDESTFQGQKKSGVGMENSKDTILFWACIRKITYQVYKSIVLPGRGLFIPSWVFKKIGFFDEKALPQYKADYDFVLRANKNNIHSFISWDSIIFSYVETTGKGSTFTRQSLFAFCISLFQKKSRTNFFQNFLYYKRHLPLWSLPLFPFTALMILMRHFFLFFKERKY